MKLRSTVFLFAIACFAVINTTGLGCSSNTVVTQQPDSGQAACDPAQCAPKNECLADGQGVTKCRLPCTSQTECPFNYQCAASSPKNFCVKNNLELERKPTGQWGFPCKPTDGFDNNPACDTSSPPRTCSALEKCCATLEGSDATQCKDAVKAANPGGCEAAFDGLRGKGLCPAQKFACYAETPTDAAAYCTIYDCQSDLDCTGGYWCATINEAPNATTAQRRREGINYVFGVTRTVCLKRTYCSPCKGDVDCPSIDGKKQICATDANGTGFCTTECTASNQCALDAACTADNQPAQVCVPKAGVCKGDGSLCSPCYSDADCPEGACVRANYSTEKFCTVKSKVACSQTTRDCPAAANGWRVSCVSAVDPDYPKDACVGVVRLDDGTSPSYVIGCWTGNRITR
jgi:hypothetical protein